MMNSLNTLCTYVCRFQQALDSGLPYDMKEIPELNNCKNILELGKPILFAGNDKILPSGYSNWTKEHLKRIRILLIEWVVKQKTKEGKEVHQNTLKSYVFGVQRGFRAWGYDIDLFDHPVFKCKKEGLIPVLDNRAIQLQSSGRHTKSQNVLSRADLSWLYSSDLLSKVTPKRISEKNHVFCFFC